MATSSSPKSIAASRTLQAVRAVTSTPPRFTPMVIEDFEAKALGLATADGWYKADYVDSPVYTGARAIKFRTGGSVSEACPYGPGATLYAGRKPTPALIPKGEAIWQRFYMYFPSEFSFGYKYSGGAGSSDGSTLASCGFDPDTADGNPGLKFLVFSPDVGTSRSYFQITVGRRVVGQPAGAEMRFVNESNPSSNRAALKRVPLDRWFAMQFAMKVADDNTGFMRAWVDDELIVEAVNVPTISATANGVNEWGMGDYWNGYPWTDGVEGRNAFYVNDIIVASTLAGYGTPTGVDASGNAYISPLTTVGDLS
jgi:hypothetical protein